MANIKIERLNRAFQQEISMIIMREIKDEDIKFVTITDCKVTNDLSFAKVYYTVYNMDRKKETEEALKHASGYIRHLLHDRVDIRHIPELTFVYDESIAYGKRIENIIEEIHDEDK